MPGSRRVQHSYQSGARSFRSAVQLVQTDDAQTAALTYTPSMCATSVKLNDSGMKYASKVGASGALSALNFARKTPFRILRAAPLVFSISARIVPAYSDTLWGLDSNGAVEYLSYQQSTQTWDTGGFVSVKTYTSPLSTHKAERELSLESAARPPRRREKESRRVPLIV